MSDHPFHVDYDEVKDNVFTSKILPAIGKVIVIISKAALFAFCAYGISEQQNKREARKKIDNLYYSGRISEEERATRKMFI